MKSIDLAGQRFGRLTVIERVRPKSGMKWKWKCKCDCSSVVEVWSYDLITGNKKSCGCLRTEMLTAHGMSRTRVYHIWSKMMSRCNKPNEIAYHNYGGRGIRVCDKWQEFIPFYNWAIASGYNDELSIDRINNDGNYEPSNCKWSTRKEQANNKRNNIWLEYRGEVKTISQWSDICGIPRAIIGQRIRAGWSVEKALIAPNRNKKVARW